MVVWDTDARDLKSQGNADSALYLQHHLRAGASEVTKRGPYKLVPFTVYQRLSDYSTTYNAESGEQISWVLAR